MPSLLRWLSDLVGSIYFLQVIWTPIKQVLRLDHQSRADSATARLLMKRRPVALGPPLEPVFRFVGAAPSGGGVRALFVNEGAGVTEVSIVSVGAAGDAVHPSDRIEAGASGWVDLKVTEQAREVPFELAYTDAAGMRQSQPFVFLALDMRVEAVDVLAVGRR